MEHKPENRICQNCKKDFIIETEDFNFYEKIKGPPPTFCPECRMIRRLRARNERALFKTNCGLCGKSTVTMYNPQNQFVVYCNSCYLSDKWDPLDYGRDYDFSKPFFIQFANLMKVVPRKTVHSIGGGVNTEYSNYLVNAKESYLSYSVTGSERIYHSRVVDNSKECVDCSNIKECESCYENIFGTKNYGSVYLVDSRNCIDSKFLFDCANCSDCFMSANLRNKKYIFRGEQFTKEKYNELLLNIKTDSFKIKENLIQEFKKMIKSFAIHRFARIFKSENCTGNHIENSKNVKNSFEIFKAEDSKYSARLTDGPADLYDVMGSGKSELVYEASGAAWGSQNSAFFSSGGVTVDSQYCDFCINVSNCFGSISLSHNKNVILNKQYSKEEYEKLRKKIIEHMNSMPYIDNRGIKYVYGEFFPQICIPHSYNQSTAQEYFPLTKEEIENRGYLWRNSEEKKYQPTFSNNTIPDSIGEISDNFSEEIIECSHKNKCKHICTGVFRVHPNELIYLRKWNLPIPRLCPNCRYYERLNFRTLLKLYKRICMCNQTTHNHHDKCMTEFETSYAPDRPEKVYCESCYNKEIY